MSRIRSLDDFKDYRGRYARTREDGRPCLVVCAGTGGQASGSNDIIRVIKRHILEHGLHDRISLRITGCLGFCEMDPFILVEPGNQLYPKLEMEDVPRIVDAALAGEVLEDLLYREPGTEQVYDSQADIPFFRGQTRRILGYNQRIDPIRMGDYLRAGGYAGFENVLDDPDPDRIISEVKNAGLRGRGGAGFPAGVKWELARKNAGSLKYVVCNADEGDPGAYMDRSLLEGNPHLVLEGLIIAGIAIGATKGIIYVRSEYPLAIKHSMIAIRQARETGLLGQDILGTGIDFDIEIVQGAGAFVCGEETALIHSIEGLMGEPRQRPPYPIQKGIEGHPTCINNVETLANVPTIITGGAAEYASLGTEGNTGTKIFSLVGKIRNTGLVEVPLGTPIADVVHEIGGGAPGGARVKAVQTGGPSGGCIPASMFDLPIGYDSLAKAGSIMGSGGMIVMDDDTCMVDVARYFMGFLKEESCGKCFTCRKGTQRMYEILEDITKGQATLKDLDLLEELALAVRDTTMCGLGQSAPNPVLSTLKYFRHEYVSHIVDKRCDAFVCNDLVGAPCQSACPVGTEAWRYIAHIANGELDQAYHVIREANPFPSVCARVCTHPCESHCRNATAGGEAVAVRALKRYVTDHVDPSSYQPVYESPRSATRVAVVGAGPAGLTAAHLLSLKGYMVTVFDSARDPGGMLLSGIPSYRLPRETIRREVDALLNDRIHLALGKVLGKDVTVDDLLRHEAIFLATGAHCTSALSIGGGDVEGVQPALDVLKTINEGSPVEVRGRVGIIGGGNTAIDAARAARRLAGVDRVTIYYRRTQREMPADAAEIEAALEEGIHLETLVSPVKVGSSNDRLCSVEFVRNTLGSPDASGRRRPVPDHGQVFAEPMDYLLMAIGDRPDAGLLDALGVEITSSGTPVHDRVTLQTTMPAIFAGGDVATGPNTVVHAIAAGKTAALSIDRFLRGEPLRRPAVPRLPTVHVPQLDGEPAEHRVQMQELPAAQRVLDFDEVELGIPAEQAVAEARRCLRCDLEFTSQPEEAAAQAGEDR